MFATFLKSKVRPDDEESSKVESLQQDSSVNSKQSTIDSKSSEVLFKSL